MKPQISIYVLIIGLIIIYIQCSDKQNELVNRNIESDGQFENIEIDISKAKEIFLEEIFDSISFVPLDRTDKFIRSDPDLLRIYKNKLFYLDVKSNRESAISVFDKRSGKNLYVIESQFDVPNAIESIRCFDILQDTLYVLNKEKLSVFQIGSDNMAVRALPDIELGEWYTHFAVTRKGFVCFNQMLPYALYFKDRKGVNVSTELPFLNNYPTFQADNFPHFFRSTTSNDLAFFFRFNPEIYRIPFIDNVVDSFLKFDFGPYEIEKSKLTEMTAMDVNDYLNVKNTYCNTDGMFCSFSQFFICEDYYFASFKVAGIFYICLIEKKTGRHRLFKGQIDDISKYWFLNSTNRTLSIKGVDGNNLIYVLDAEYVAEIAKNYKPYDADILSNWNVIKSKITSTSNPIVVYFQLSSKLFSEER